MVTHDFICWDEQLDNTLGNHHAVLLIETHLTEESPCPEALAVSGCCEDSDSYIHTQALLFLLLALMISV